jgi:hypothetical protein
LEILLENQDDFKHKVGKQLSPLSYAISQNDNLCFGSWEVRLKEMNCEYHVEFLPNLYGIKGPTLPTLILLDDLGGSLPQALKTSNNSHGMSLDKETHSGSQTSHTFKYNLRSKTRGAPIFSGGIARGLGTLETIDSKPSQRGRKSLISLAHK